MIPCDDCRVRSSRIVQTQRYRVVVACRGIRGQFQQRDGIAAIECHRDLALLRFLPPTRVVGQNQRTRRRTADVNLRRGKRGIELRISLVVIFIRITNCDHSYTLGELSAILTGCSIPRCRIKECPTVKLHYVISTSCRAMIIPKRNDPTLRCCRSPVGAIPTRLTVGNEWSQFQAVEIFCIEDSVLRNNAE